MNNRIKLLRKELGLTLESFGSKVGVTRAAISNIENGRSKPSEQLILAICNVFHVNEQWLRTGEGEMFPPRNKNEQIVDFMTGIVKQPDNSAAKSFIESISHLTPDEWVLLSKIAAGWIAAMQDKENEPNP